MIAGCKYTEFVDTPDSVHNLVVQLVPEGAKVLEFGCATGYMSEVLRGRRGCEVVGVEISAEAAEIARGRADRVIVGDAEELDYEELLGNEQFDAVLFADVLEHLRDPEALLRRIRPFVAETGAVIASIPNVAHGSLRLALLSGAFRYRPTGLLDDTHLRFFTRDSIQDLFESTGYMVTHWQRHRIDIAETEIAPPVVPLPEEIQQWLASDPEVTTYQFVIRAVPTKEPSLLAELARLRELPKRVADLEQSLEGSFGDVGHLQQALESALHDQGEHTAALEARVEASSRREQQLEDLLLDANTQLLRRDEELQRIHTELEGGIRRRDEEAQQFRHNLEEAQREIQWLQGNLEQAQREIQWLQGNLEESQHEVQWLQANLEEAQRSLTTMEATRVWQLGQRYWRIRAGVGRLTRFRKP
jgi:O-antigen biosynthesis protein